MSWRAAVIGSPISHSKSPAIFSYLAARLAKGDFRYDARDVQPEALRAFLGEVRRTPSFAGFNVTIPHKEAILPLLDEITPEARAIGAVNVVHARGGRLTGHNTDVIGIEKTLEENACELSGRSAFIWGAGGAARAVAYVLGQQGAARVFVLNHSNVERARRLAGDLGALFPKTEYLALTSEAELPRFERLALAVNSTPLGMKSVPLTADGKRPERFFATLGELTFDSQALAFDLIYDPARTPFLGLASKHGLRTAGGLDMLIHQALGTWEIWFGPLSARGELKKGLSRHLRAMLAGKTRVFLTGFMGVGKSTVGSILAERLGWLFVDTDQWVEREAGTTIAELFRRSGEGAFRELERKMVLRASESDRTVVSLGGGALMNGEVLSAVRAAGDLVYLAASPEALQARLRETAATRPLLAGLDEQGQREKIRSLLSEREAVYLSAGIRVETDGKGPEEIAHAIEEALLA